MLPLRSTTNAAPRNLPPPSFVVGAGKTIGKVYRMDEKVKRAADHNAVMAAISEHDEQVAVVEYLYKKYPTALFWATQMAQG